MLLSMHDNIYHVHRAPQSTEKEVLVTLELMFYI